MNYITIVEENMIILVEFKGSWVERRYKETFDQKNPGKKEEVGI